MFDRLFRLSENGTDLKTEVLAGSTTFLTMSYIIFVQPAVLSGQLLGIETGLDFGAVTTATCLAAALATGIMGFYARYPIGQAPGMGENFFFVLSVLPAAGAMIAAEVETGQIAPGSTTAWQVGLGVVLISGLLFLGLTLLGVRQKMLDAFTVSLRHGIAVGIGLFIAFLGLKNGRLILPDAALGVKLNVEFASPDLIVFFVGLLTTAGLLGRRRRGAILWGILAALTTAMLMKYALPIVAPIWTSSDSFIHSRLAHSFHMADRIVSAPPSIAPTFFAFDIFGALSIKMVPFILILLVMDLFDTLGTLVGVGERAGLIDKDGKLPRARQAMLSDAVGTVAGAALGTSTVTSFIESAAGVEQGGRTGLTALVVACFFLIAPFFAPIIAMVGGYAPITAPALVVVGSLMMANVGRIAWDDPTESIPAFLLIIGIPLTGSIADGLALGLISYPIIKLISGRKTELGWPIILIAAVMVFYLVGLRMPLGY
jgi:adenine/guanine/hypoxanthine permease